MKKSDQLRQQIAALTDEAQAYLDVAEAASRDLTADEQKSFDAAMAKIDPLKVELESTVAHEAKVAELRAMRAVQNTPVEPVLPVSGRTPGNDGAALNIRVVNPSLRAFRGNGNKDQAVRDAYDCGLWFRALAQPTQANRDKLAARRGDWLATLNETQPQDGGYLVPPAFENAVITYREIVGVTRKLARVVQMPSDSWTFLKQSGGTTVYYPGEETAITASDFDFARVTLTAKKRAILSYVSNELRDDAVVSIMDLLATDMGHQFALQEDAEAIKGDGTSTYGGVLGLRPAAIAATAGTATAATGNDTWPELTYADCAAAMSKVADKYQTMPLAWLCSAAFKWQVFDRLCLAQGGALSINMSDGIPQAMFAGYPIYVCDRMPTSTAAATVAALFGSFQNCLVLGERTGVRVDVSEHYAFNTDQIAVRGTVRYDLKVHEQGDTSTAGALASLKTAA